MAGQMLPTSSRPDDATLSVAKAARRLGVHANTVRAWSDQGRLRHYRINARGDRRYRPADLEAFLDDTLGGAGPVVRAEPGGSRTEPGGSRAESRGSLELRALERLRAAHDFERMSTWAAQLQSIQKLGVRLSRFATVEEIGTAIARELRSLIDYHNVRVYRLRGDELVPVAMLGQVGTYYDETPEQLRVSVDRGLTGWVARYAIPQLVPDAARDPRAVTIPGTEEDLDESMILAPMIFEERVLGVIVLSKLGTCQFTDDDLRLLVIYASFAAQAMAIADASEQLRAQSTALERQVRSQRELLRITESILGTLEPKAVLAQIAERLGALVEYDDLAIEVVDPATGHLTSLTARGLHADSPPGPRRPEEAGLAGWVLAHGETVAIPDARTDGRTAAGDGTAAAAALLSTPLRGREGTTGVLTLERSLAPVGPGPFLPEEVELVQLFAAHVSIALRNASVHSAVEVLARTDGLTTLFNHATFQERLERAVREGEPFSLILLDLDDFKAVNDRLGHQAGDAYLREVAGALLRAARETDVAFRYGGDEFVLMLPATSGEGAARVAARVRDSIASTRTAGLGRLVRELAGTASIGVATFPHDGAAPEDVLLAADRAMFVAKRAGGDRVGTAADGRLLDARFSLQSPTPVDSVVPPPELRVPLAPA